MKITGTQRHPFVCAETDKRRLLWFDVAGNVARTVELPYGVSYEVWPLPDGATLFCHYGLGSDGVSIVDERDNLLFRYETKGEIFSCQPLPNGNILLGEVQGRCITEIDRKGQLVLKIPVDYTGDSPHNAMRMVRKHAGGYYAVQPGSQEIAMFDLAGKPLKRYATRPDTFGAVLRPNGNLIYTHHTGAVEITPDGTEIWELKASDVPEIGIQWLLGLQLLPNGNLVFCNWMGHGCHRKGIPIFEITPQKQVVWAVDCTDIAEEPANLRLLDVPLAPEWGLTSSGE